MWSFAHLGSRKGRYAFTPSGFPVLNPRGPWTGAARAMWLLHSDPQIPLRLKREGLSSKASWLGAFKGLSSPLGHVAKMKVQFRLSAGTESEKAAWPLMWDRHMGQWHLMETKGSHLGPKAGPDLRGLYKPFPEAKCFYSCYQPPVCHCICYEIWKLLLRASYLVSIFHYSLLFHFKKVSLHLICFMLLLICHQFIQLLHTQVTDTPSEGLPLKQMLFCSGANIEEKNNSQSLMLEAQDYAHLKPVFFWISKAK